MKTREHDPHATTMVLPRDELAPRRQSKPQTSLAPGLSLAQIQRLLVAAELRKRANQDE